jgi:hypothetical protein
MNRIHELEAVGKRELQTYRKSSRVDLKTHIPFSGSPKKHPHDPEWIILISDPFTAGTFYYEFRVQDIGFAEELAGIITIDGETVPMVRIWVKKRSVAIQCNPFLVDSIQG